MIWYTSLKFLHVTLALLSIGGFSARWVGMMLGAAWVKARLTRVLPHIIDTALLASAIALAFLLRQAPLTHDWLTAKVGGLIIYIILGSLALKRARTRRTRVLCFILALGVFAWIISVARLHHPLGLFLLIG